VTSVASGWSTMVRTRVATRGLLATRHLGQEIPRGSGCDRRCRVTPGRVSLIASTSPWWASAMTSTTPVSPRATSERQQASQPALVLSWWQPRRRGYLRCPSRIHSGDDEHVDVDGPASLSYLDHQGIRPDDRGGAAVWGTGAKGSDLGV